ncbi:hypothetical protein ACFLIN_06915 [Corynebacterium kutscheri]|uniref:hypothetical protein n=1 Tax=Corynebacterium kutscheri TaxID=35755 RepID=UPI0037BE9880
MAITIAPDEQVRVDVTTSLAGLSYSVIQLIFYTAVFWMVIGFLDRMGTETVSVDVRNAVVALWLAVVIWRFIIPIASLRRRRFILTDRRLILRTPGMRGYTEEFSLQAIRKVQRKRRTLVLGVVGYNQTISITDIPRAKRVATMLVESLPVVSY